MSDHAHNNPRFRKVHSQEGQPRPTYSLGEFLAAIAAEPHRLADLLDDDALPSHWEDAQAAVIARNTGLTPKYLPMSTPMSDPCDDTPDPRDARIAQLIRQLWCLSLALTAISVVAIFGWVG